MGKPNHSAQLMPDDRFRLSGWPYCGSGKGAETCASRSALPGDLPAHGWVWWGPLTPRGRRGRNDAAPREPGIGLGKVGVMLPDRRQQHVHVKQMLHGNSARAALISSRVIGRPMSPTGWRPFRR
jgi:hypothetical protein